MSSGFLGGLFGKKDKNPQQPPAPPAPKPVPAPAPASKLQPGLTPVPARTNIGAATTQPMVLPKSGGLKPAKPALISGGKSTQRIVLPGRSADAAGAQPNMPAGNLSLPLGMIVRLLPESVRAISMAEFEALPEADQDVSLPLGLILPQLPSGKVEVAVQELVAAIPRNYVRPQEEIAPHLGTLVSMPLMDVVMRIPPDMLALRPDQKEVDAAVVNMADPFTEELLREQAEAARKAEAEKQAAAAPAPVAPTPPAPTTPVAPPSPVASQPLPEGMPTIPLPRPVAGKPPVTPTVPPPAPFKSASGPRPPSISLPRPGARPPTPPTPVAPAAAAPVVPPAPPAPIVPPPAPVAPAPVEAPAATEGGLSEEMKQLLAAAEAELGEGGKQDSPVVPEPVEEKAAALPPAPPLPPAPVVPEPEPVIEPEPVAATPPPPIPAPMPPPPPMAIKPPPTPTPIAPPPPAPRAVTPPPPPAAKPAVLPPPPAPMAVPPPPAPAPVAAAPAVEEAPAPTPIPAPAPVVVPPPPAQAIPAPVAVAAPSVPAPTPTPAPVAPKAATRSVDLNTCSVDQLAASGCPRLLAEAIVGYRANQGPFRRLEDLLKVPGITKAAYALLTGKEVTTEDLLGSVNEVLGFPADQEVGLKDITDRISQWPDVTGCVLGQASGLPLVGKVPAGLEKSAVMAFVPRMLSELNGSFKEFSGRETNELSIPTKGTSYHIFRNDKLYLVIMSRRRQLPRRYTKVARYVLSSIDASRHQ